MDAVKFLKEKNRMCNKYKNCFECPVGTKNGGCQAGIVRDQEVTEEELVSIVENWASEHPVKTRQSEFLKMFPDAKLIDNEIIFMCPKFIDETYKDDKDCLARKCYVCKKKNTGLRRWNDVCDNYILRQMRNRDTVLEY